MLINHIPGSTRELGRSQNYVPLPIRDDFVLDPKKGVKLHVMVTSWQPTPEELAALAAGAPIYLSIFSGGVDINTTDMECIMRSRHPPVRLFVGDVPTLTGG
jgi:hypothetical protein